MSNITCPGCSNPLRVEKRYVNCPWCGTPLSPAYVELAQRLPPKRAPLLSVGEMLAAGTVAVAGLTLIFLGSGWSAPRAPADREQTQVVSSGLTICQQNLSRPSRSGKAQVPPRVANQGAGTEFYYEWPEGSFYFERPDGAPVPMRATCRGRLATGRLTELTLNGIDLLQLPPVGEQVH